MASSEFQVGPDVFESIDAHHHHEVMYERFEAARRRHPDRVSAWTFLLGGRPVHAEVVGERTRELMSAFDHLPRVDFATEPELRIRFWDQSSTGVEDPTPSRAMSDGGGYHYSADERHLTQLQPSISLSFRRDPARLVAAVNDTDSFPVRQKAKPFSRPLALWLNDSGCHFVHAGLVAHQGRGVLLVGAGGAGKSNTALACLDHGLQFLADDYCILDGRIGHSIYASALLARTDLARYATARTTAVEPVPADDPKTGLFLAATERASLRSSVPISAIGVCRVASGPDTHVVEGGRASALLGLAPDSVLLLSTRRRGSFAALSELVEHTRCFELRLGRRTAGIADAVRSLVA